MKKSYTFILVVIIIAIVLVVVTYITYFQVPKSAPNTDNNIACTLEAKLCPDGSYVGRSGPKCEFTECPAILIPNGWQTYTSTSTNVTYNYPSNIGTTYVNTVDWPPVVQVSNDAFSCNSAGNEVLSGGKTEQRDINGQTFCVTKESGGAAGSVYNNYAYVVELNNKKIILTFSLRYPQCVNYDEPKRSMCQAEEDSFNVDELISKIVSTIKF